MLEIKLGCYRPYPLKEISSPRFSWAGLRGQARGKAGGRTLGRRASWAERETVGRAGGSKWAAEKKGGGLGRSGWAGAGLTLVVGLFSISLFYF